MLLEAGLSCFQRGSVSYVAMTGQSGQVNRSLTCPDKNQLENVIK